MKNAMTVLGLQDFSVSEQETIEALLSARLQDLRAGSFGDSGLDIDELELCISSYSASITDNQRIELAQALVGKYETHPLFVLLSKEYEGDSRYTSKYDSIVTKTVQLALALAEMGPEYADDIYVVCRRVWLLQKKDESEFLRRICSFEQPLKKIREKLLAISNVDHEQITALRDVIEEWCSVIQRVLLSKPKQKHPKPGDVLSLDPDVVSHDDIGENGATLSVVSPADEGIYPMSDREIQHDRSPQGQLTRVQDESSSADRSDGMIALRGLEVLNGLQMRYATPPCYYARLTDGEIQGAFDFCLKKLDRSPAYLILLLSMIYGRSVERLSKIKRRQSSSSSGCGDFWAIGKETTGLGYNPDLPRHSGFGLIDSKAHNGLLLPLPPAIGSSLRHLLATNDGRLPSIDVTEAIRTLRKKVSSRITALRLQLSLRASLLSLGTDEAIVGLLAGVAAKHCAALYYVHTSESLVHQAYFDYLDMRLPKRLTKRWPLPSRHVGSRLRVSAELVSILFFSQATRISAARKGAQIDPVEYHNELVIYTWQVLGLVSGSRAVTEPFGTLSDLDLTSGTLRLADKNNRREGAYRTIALCDLASRQVNQYLQNLQYLASTVDVTNPELSTYIGRVLDGREPWLFLIRGRNAIALRPKEIQRIVWHRWRAPLNWTRHFLRSWFLEKGTSRGVARAFMGHADMGAAPQSRFDATSMFELKQLARQIDELLLSLNIPVVKAWNTYS